MIKKNRFFMLCGLAALLLLSACAAGVPESTEMPATSTPVITPAPAPTTEPEPTPAPLTEGELFYPKGEPVTMAQLEERFGELTECYASYEAGTAEVLLRLSWYTPGPMWASSMVEVWLFGNGDDWSFFKQLSDGEGHEIKPSVEDRQIPLDCRNIQWARTALPNPRGIRIGMTMEDIQAVYAELIYQELDMSIYPEDYLENNPSTPDSALHAFSMPSPEVFFTPTNNMILPDMPDYYEYAVFYFQDGILVSMEQGCGGTTFRP